MTSAAESTLVDRWHELLGAHARVHGQLERALKPHELGVSEYEVLERLAGEDFAEQRRMQELGEALHLSQSALSRVVGRLEKDGLAERGMCAQDRRGIYVCITERRAQAATSRLARTIAPRSPARSDGRSPAGSRLGPSARLW